MLKIPPYAQKVVVFHIAKSSYISADLWNVLWRITFTRKLESKLLVNKQRD